MKKRFLLSPLVFGQVDLNTQKPQSTLDLVFKGGKNDIDGLLIPGLTRKTTYR